MCLLKILERLLYKHKMMKRTDFYEIFRALTLIFFSILMLSGAAKAQEGVFSINNVKVDVTAKNAAAARSQAFSRAQVLAFSRLMNKMMSETQQSQFSMPDKETVSLMVKDFEIVSEKLSAVRYVGVYNFRFKGDEVRKLLGTLGVQYSDVQSRPILLFPFYQLGAKTYLWGETNPWMKAWRETSSYSGLVPIMVPIGDLTDMSDIRDDQSLTYNQQTMRNMMQRYNVQDAIVTIAVPDRHPQVSELGQALGVPLTVYVYRVDAQGPTYIRRLNMPSDVTETMDTAMSKAVMLVRKEVSKDWKRQTAVHAGHQSYIEATVPFRNMQQWIETKRYLESQQAISSVAVQSIMSSQARVKIDYRGSVERLKLSLAQSDMTLEMPNLMSPYQTGYRVYLNRYTPVTMEPVPMDVEGGTL